MMVMTGLEGSGKGSFQTLRRNEGNLDRRVGRIHRGKTDMGALSTEPYGSRGMGLAWVQAKKINSKKHWQKGRGWGGV